MSIQNNTAPVIAQADCGVEISSGGIMQVAVAASCNGTTVKKVNLKSKKLVRYPVVNMWLGSRQLLFASRKAGKKAKHKRSRTIRRVVACKDAANISCLNEQLTSTSATACSETVESTSSRRKRPHASARSKDDTQSSKNKQKVDGVCVGAGTSAPSGSAGVPKSDPSASVDAKLVAAQPVSIRATDLMEATG